MERGSLRPEHRPSSTSWLLVYPDTYEIGLPNQGLQILYEILNERDDAVAERAYAPWLDMDAAMRAASVPLFSVDTHHARGRLRRARLRPRRRARLHQRARVPRPRRRAGAGRGPPARAPARGRRRALRVQPRAHGRLRRRVRHRRRRGGGRRDHRGGRRVEARRGARQPRGRAARAGDDPRRLRARRCTTSSYDGPFIAEVRPRFPDVPERGREAHRRRPRRVALPQAASSSRSSRWCTTGSTSRCSAAAPGAAGSARRG